MNSRSGRAIATPSGTCACLLPVMFIGLWVGRRLTHRLSREAFVRLVTWLVLASGLALIGRYLSA